MEEFNERIETKADKLMLANAINLKANKGDVDSAVVGKADFKEVEKLLMAL